MIAGRPVRNMSAAVLAAAVLYLAPVNVLIVSAQNAQANRFPAGPADMFKPGSALTFYNNTRAPARIEGLNTALDAMTAHAEAVAQARRGIAEGVAASDADDLARDVAASLEGTFSIVVQAGFIRAMSQTNPAIVQMLQTAQMNISVPGDTRVDVPVLIGAAIHSLTVMAAGEKIRSAGSDRDLSGAYALTAQGECAMRDGAVTISQQDFVLEGVSGEDLVLYGASGLRRIYLVANEQRYAAILQASGTDPVIEVPDRPSDLFEAEMSDPGTPLAFKSITRGTCRFTLTPAG